MPAPARMRPVESHREAGRGFSLIELLVVIFIIGVLATMFTLSIGVTGGDRQLETEVNRLAAVVDLAREEASVGGRELGLRFFRDGYEFSAYHEDFVEYHDEETPDASEWSPLDRTSLLGPRRLPEGMVFELTIDERDVVLKPAEDRPPPVPADTTPENASDDDTADTGKRDDTVSRYRPQVMIYSSGDISPFVVRLRREFENSGSVMDFDFDGSVEIDSARDQ